MSKTPFEIRLELLKLAKDSLFEPVYQEREQIMQEVYYKREEATNAGKQIFPEFPAALPTFPSTDDIIVQAEKFNKFVSSTQ